MRFSNLILICLLVGCSASAAETRDANDLPPAEWTTVGTEWIVNVKQYSRSAGKGYSDPRMAERALRPKVQYEFHMRITVLEPWGEGDHRIARIRFSTLEDAPEFAHGTFVLELYANTGKPKALKEIDGNRGGSIGIVKTGEERVLFSTTPGFPTAWIVSAADLARMPTEPEERRATIETRTSIGKSSYQFVKKLRPTVPADGEDPVLEVEAAIIERSPGASRRIVQTWVPGEGWWRSFTRYSYTGNPDLEATVVDSEGK